MDRADLRNLADTPERAAEIHVNEGVCEVFDVVFPPKGTLITPEWPAATNARSFVLLRCLGLLAGVVAKRAELSPGHADGYPRSSLNTRQQRKLRPHRLEGSGSERSVDHQLKRRSCRLGTAPKPAEDLP